MQTNDLHIHTTIEKSREPPFCFGVEAEGEGGSYKVRVSVGPEKDGAWIGLVPGQDWGLVWGQGGGVLKAL